MQVIDGDGNGAETIYITDMSDENLHKAFKRAVKDAKDWNWDYDSPGFYFSTKELRKKAKKMVDKYQKMLDDQSGWQNKGKTNQ